MTLSSCNLITAGNQIPGHAIVTARQLASFRSFLIQEQVRTGIAMIDPTDAEGDDLSYRFDARVCPIALACFARLFDYDAEVIGVIEAAQFEARRVTISRIGGDGDIAMTVSTTPDEGRELMRPA